MGIAAYHYIRIFNSWVDAYEYPRANAGQEYPDFRAQAYPDPKLTGVPFNDAYRYMDWLLTVPLLLIEIVLCMKLNAAETSRQCWFFSMCVFLYIVYTLLVGLADATNKEEEETVRTLISQAQVMTVVSWLTYPVVYIFPMLGFAGSHAVVAIQCGYCASDIISKCGVGLIIYQITAAKSELARKNSLLP